MADTAVADRSVTETIELRSLAASGERTISSRGQALRRDSIFRRALGLADVTAIAITFLAAFAAQGHRLEAVALTFPALVVLLSKAIGLYDRDEHLLHRTTLDEVPSLFGLATTTALLTWLVGDLLVTADLSRGEVAVAWLLFFVALIVMRAGARAAARRLVATERCLFVGGEASATEFAGKLQSSRSVNAELVGWLPYYQRRRADDRDERAATLAQVLALVQDRDVDRVIVGPGVPQDALEELRRAGSGAKVSVLPQLSRVVQSSAEIDRLNGISLLGLRPFEITISSRFVKRLFDIVGSLFGLLITAPLMLAVAVAIKLDSRGPVLFRHTRAGRHGEPFQMLKFRSMVEGADEQKDALRHMNEADGVFKIANDPRITRLGRLVRRAHLDELPQLVNVLRGEMSLVGPRPLPLDEDARIEGWHRRRLDLRPGITGPWQVMGSARIPMREMLKLDYQYVANWSLWNDIRILLLTIPRVLGRGGM